jgi:hypothetical protein
MPQPIQLHTIQMTPRIFAEQLAVCWMSAPEHSEEEQLLEAALNLACARIGVPSEDLVEEISQNFMVLQVDEDIPKLSMPGGAA